MTVHFKEITCGNGRLGLATLDVEKTLNSLSLPMIKSLYAQLEAWKKDSQILAVLIQGQGKAFCAGGDIKALYGAMAANSTEEKQYIQDFFEHEYRLDCSLYHYPKTLVVWAHGITMGGGMGILQGANIRIVTDSTRMAMPEITIGLIPDVGASYFLKKAPQRLGLFVALSGVRLKGADICQLNLADYFLEDKKKEEFLELISRSTFKNAAECGEFIEKFFKENTHTGEQELPAHEAFIQTLLEHKSALSLMNWAQSYEAKNEWEATLMNTTRSACPTSIALIYAIWEKSQNWNVSQSFYNEWYVASQCGYKGNFREGVRALLIDKDKKPQWVPAKAEDITQDYLEEFFKSPREDGKNPLQDLLEEK
jgi:enoyl-CoA hydratase/carnithine racemase